MRLMMLVSTVPDGDRTRAIVEVFDKDAGYGKPPVYRFQSTLTWSPDVPADKVLAYAAYVLGSLHGALDHELDNDGISLYSETIQRPGVPPTPRLWPGRPPETL